MLVEDTSHVYKMDFVSELNRLKVQQLRLHAFLQKRGGDTDAIVLAASAEFKSISNQVLHLKCILLQSGHIHAIIPLDIKDRVEFQ